MTNERTQPPKLDDQSPSLAPHGDKLKTPGSKDKDRKKEDKGFDLPEQPGQPTPYPTNPGHPGGPAEPVDPGKAPGL